MIQLESIYYSYPNSGQPALNGIDLKIAVGQFVLLTGASGSGKTTLLRCINGLVPHFSGGEISGNVQVNSVNVIENGPNILSQHVGFVAQNPEGHALLDKVEPEIAFALENAAISDQEMRVRVEEALDLLDLTALRDRSINSLSGGERQRVAIAAVLALRPQILLLDEPTSQLDPKSAEDVLRSLTRLNEDLGLTIVLVEHRLERVIRYVDRIIFMEEGKISVDDSARKALAKMPHLPPLASVGRALGWDPLPMTVKEGLKYASETPAGYSETSSNLSKGEIAVTSAPPLLALSDIHFDYDGEVALDGINLQVFAGEVLAIMGRNGSGKSTLLKCIMGLLQISRGEIRLKGKKIMGQDVAELARDIAYLPQNPNDLLFAETVNEEFQITLSNHGLNGQIDADTLISDLGLSNLKSNYPRDLSTGQRQRVALGSVTIAQPNLLLLDEPTRGLDVQNKYELTSIWRHWLTKGMGLILVTHDVEMAAIIADRVAILSQGEIIASGPTAEILGGSPLFAPQIARLFPRSGWLTAQDALEQLVPLAGP